MLDQSAGQGISPYGLNTATGSSVLQGLDPSGSPHSSPLSRSSLEG